MSIQIDLMIIFVFIIYCFTNQRLIFFLTMFFIILHELGHMICGIILGLEIKKIRIMPVGFSMEFKINKKDYNKKIIKSNNSELKKIIIAFGGPFVNCVIIFISLILKFNKQIIYSNLLILILNMLPIYPLDGGRILKSLLKILVGNKKSLTITTNISNVFVIIVNICMILFIYYFKNIALIPLIIYLWYLVITENKIYHLKTLFFSKYNDY